MEDLDFVLTAIDPWLDKYISQGANALSADEAIGVGVWLLESEVNNGGFDQYYFNTGGSLATKTVEALRTIGAYETAGILEAANADIPALPLPEDRNERSAVLDKVGQVSRFRALETEFYSERENRIGLLAKYLMGRSYGA
jgi:hypothetical protein